MSFRVSLVAALSLATGCGPVIVLGDSDAVCLALGCGGVSQGGVQGLGGSSAGVLVQAGSSSPPIAGSGGAGGGPGDGGASGQAGEAPSTLPCQPALEDHICDGFDAACQPDPDDAGCSETCQGSFVGGSAYMSCLAAADFDDAEAACQANGMHLVKIDSADENATVLSLAPDDYVWIGGSSRDDPSVYAWLDGTPFYASGAAVGATYQNFGASEPSKDSELRCVQLREQGAGTWSMWRCSGMQSFVCERYEL
jgi:hypothetical protein